MEPECRNIYKTGRKAAGFTQEAAAERMGICVESVRAYETGRSIPPNDVLERMCIVYNDMILAFQHVRELNGVYGQIIPAVRDCSVLEASAQLTNRIFAFADRHADRRLMQIAEDNVIDSTERSEYDAILEDLQGIVEAALSLRCAREGPRDT